MCSHVLSCFGLCPERFFSGLSEPVLRLIGPKILGLGPYTIKEKQMCETIKENALKKVKTEHDKAAFNHKIK